MDGPLHTLFDLLIVGHGTTPRVNSILVQLGSLGYLPALNASLICSHKAWKKIFPLTNCWKDSGLLQWMQSWTRKTSTARLSSARFLDG